VARYGQSFKDRAVARLLLPKSAALELWWPKRPASVRGRYSAGERTRIGRYRGTAGAIKESIDDHLPWRGPMIFVEDSRNLAQGIETTHKASARLSFEAHGNVGEQPRKVMAFTQGLVYIRLSNRSPSCLGVIFDIRTDRDSGASGGGELGDCIASCNCWASGSRPCSSIQSCLTCSSDFRGDDLPRPSTSPPDSAKNLLPSVGS
jgi:hypothetical protein